AATDHRVLRRPEGGADLTDRGAEPATGEHLSLPVTPFHRAGFDAGDEELSRDLGVALVMLMTQGKIDPVRYNSRALGLLEAALARAPDDVAGWEAKGYVLMLGQRPWQALTAFETTLDKSPERELALASAASLAEVLGDQDRALGYWRRA